MLCTLKPTSATTRVLGRVKLASGARCYATEAPQTSTALLRNYEGMSPSTVLSKPNEQDSRKTVVILGSGWGGFNMIRNLDPRYYRCVVVSPRSYFVFTPLLASTAVGTLEFRVATESIRDKGKGWRKLSDSLDSFLQTIKLRSANADHKITSQKAHELRLPTLELVQAVARTVDLEKKEITVAPRIEGVDPNENFVVPYDKLVIAVGSYSQTFNIKGVKEHAFFLKDVADARKIRKRILERFEAANLFIVPEEQKRELLNFCIVGGGPTGIEFAAELHDLIHDDMQFYYPSLMPFVQITIFDVAKKILGSFDDKLSSYAETYFTRQHINIRTGVSVQEVGPDSLRVKNEKGEDEVMKYGLLVWSTGLAPNPFVQSMDGVVKDKRSSLVTDDELHVMRAPKDTNGTETADPDIYAIGDCAQIRGQVLPATAQVASQKAIYLAKELNKEGRAAGDLVHSPFKFKNRGIMAYLGGWRAIMQGDAAITGRTAWLLWRGAYLSMCVSFKNKILIPTYWFANWIFGRDISRF
ncbi:pyridine nucleotide-disulfide oxidoreductase-domain-containing protein [Myxozyma melibiosi]|uniref:Pyridine nucleotide-disulfide oxidoreductase-domain-containing protein n=1 Tax=Myxozyma melibiosi TaxID=54550 RepID=A0ABR1F6F8_9ASCO